MAEFDSILMDRLKTAAWIFDIDAARVVWANSAALEVWRAETLDELLGRDLRRDMSPAVARRLRQYQEDFRRADCRFSELWTIYPDGRPRSLRVQFSGISLSDGHVGMFCEAQDEVEQQPDTLRSADALLHTQLMISLYSRSGEALYRNPAARSSLHQLGDDLRSRFVEADDYATVREALDRTGETSRVVRMRTSKGIRWHEITARDCRDAVSGQPALLISEVDVSELKETEAKANYIAYHDVLTGLPNRSSVPLNVDSRIEAARQHGTHLGILFLDLDQFKLINDSLGHAFGDRVLVEVAQLLVKVCDDRDCVIRLGGDEFLVIISGRSADEYEAVARRILRLLSMPISVGDRRLSVTPSIGISVYPDDGLDSVTLMTSADLAMYDAKAAGRNCLKFFTPAMRARAESRLEMESSIKAALANGEFEVYYQPRVATKNIAIVGAEALVRWNHPRQGLISPARFIPVCEETGLIDRLGEFVLRTAMTQQRRWSDQGYPLSVSVNVSQRQMAGSGFLGVVADALSASGCDPHSIELEMTESLLMQGDDSAKMLERLRRHGLRISVDDFGTGYSNLARLHEFAIDCVKIDRGFVKGLPDNKALAEIIIAMCKLMNVKIVAEGVENLEQLLWLRGRGCEEFQGFYFSKPVPVGAFNTLVETQRSRGRTATRLNG